MVEHGVLVSIHFSCMKERVGSGQASLFHLTWIPPCVTHAAYIPPLKSGVLVLQHLLQHGVEVGGVLPGLSILNL